jgi:phosphoserine phosphatase
VRFASYLIVALLVGTASNSNAASLNSWNDGPTKSSIVNFVKAAVLEGGPGYIAPADRIAVFDNDGTLWGEQPLYFQLVFALDRVKAMAPEHPEWKTQAPFAALLKGDVKGALAGGEKAILEIVMASHSGMTTDEFTAAVAEWIESARHPKHDRLYSELVYKPMLNLLDYLRANGFETWIVSGGGVEFMRVFSERVYGIPPQQVVGSTITTKFEMRAEGPVLVRQPKLDFLDDKGGKPVAINKFIGRRPVIAFGNSDGDHQMLQWTAAGDGPRLMGLVHHTDADREWAYDRESHIGKLDQALDEAKAKGWTVVDMKSDWRIVFE